MDLEAVAPTPTLFAVGNAVFESGVDGQATRQVFAVEGDLAGDVVPDPNGETVYYIDAGMSPSLWAADLESGEEREVCAGAIQIVGAPGDGTVVVIGEGSQLGAELWRVKLSTGEVDVLAGSLGQAVCDRSASVFGFLGSSDPAEPSALAAVYLREEGSSAVMVRPLSETEAASVAAVTEERLLFVVTPDGDPTTGELFSYEIESGQTTSVADDVRFLSASDDLKHVLLEVHPEPGDISVTQPIVMEYRDSGAWQMMPVGDAAAGASFFGKLSADGATALVCAGTLGVGDTVRVVDVTSGAALLDSQQSDALVLDARLAPDSSCTTILTANDPTGSAQASGFQELAVIELATGDSTILARIPSGSGAEVLRIIDVGSVPRS